MAEPIVWLVDDDASNLWVLDKALSADGLKVQCYSSAEAALTESTAPPSAVLTDVLMGEMDAHVFMQKLRAKWPELPVIIMTAHADLEAAVTAYAKGAFEYLPKPFDIDHVTQLVRRAIDEYQRKTPQFSVVEQGSVSKHSLIIGQSEAMQPVFRMIGRLAHSDINVLVRGESGTGKELVAKALHQSSPRARQPFIEINTAAIPPGLLESELFGHEKGAFTGANQRRLGRFEQAHGGTLFLDEIGDMPAELQTRLLRALSEQRFYRVGGTQLVDVDVRIIAATNQPLEQRVSEGEFRLDLYHRLNVVSITLPPLSERAQDIQLLATNFLSEAASEFKEQTKQFSAQAVLLMENYAWPGNVRELQNCCRRLTVLCASQRIEAEDLAWLTPNADTSESCASNVDWQQALAKAVNTRLISNHSNALYKHFNVSFEKILIQEAMAYTDGRKHKAALLLGLGRNTLTRKLKDYGIH